MPDFSGGGPIVQTADGCKSLLDRRFAKQPSCDT